MDILPGPSVGPDARPDLAQASQLADVQSESAVGGHRDLLLDKIVAMQASPFASRPSVASNGLWSTGGQHQIHGLPTGMDEERAAAASTPPLFPDNAPATIFDKIIKKARETAVRQHKTARTTPELLALCGV